jgi:acetyltransferase-like isoleucine patch superfamily enzyme
MNPLRRFEAARTAWWLRDCTHVGAEPLLRGRPSIEASPGEIRVGDRFRLQSYPVPSHLVAGPEGLLNIGNDVSIAHGAAIAAFEHVAIGSETLIGPYVVIMDTNFHGQAGDLSLRHDCRPVRIGRGCRIGSRVTITRGATIGDGAEILAGSVVSSSIPAGACAGGARAQVLGRAGDAGSRWDGTAAALLELIVQGIGPAATPDLELNLEILQRDQGRIDSLVAALENRFGISLERSAVLRARSLTDIADELDRVRAL